MSLPKFLKPYFWDTDFRSIDTSKHKKYITLRILERGDQRALKWLFKSYNPQSFKPMVKTSRQLSPRSANFWANYFDIPRKQIKCLSKAYLQRRQQVWPY